MSGMLDGWMERNLYFLAFDHRQSFTADFLGEAEPDGALVATAKMLVFDGLCEAAGRGSLAGEAGILVDERYGADVARGARAAGLLLAMPVERSGQRELVLEYPDFEARLAAFQADYAKVLVRYNPEGDRAANRRQLDLLRQIADRVPGSGRRLMVEVLVPPEPAQLARVDGDHGRYDSELRPDLMVRTIGEMQDAGILPALWKLEGIDRREDCHRVAEQARSAGAPSRCLILGRGADQVAVLRWLRQASGVPGFAGFAVGRTIWWNPLRDWLDLRIERAEAVQAIAASYLRAVDAYRSALAPAPTEEQASGS